MSYTLCLLFEYYRYRHDAIVRVYADDRLVDELTLSSDINMKCTNNVDPLVNRFIGPTNETPVELPPVIPGKLFLFEIDERHLCNRIRIEVQNDHTNHTNGFMTKFSYLKFQDIFLLPNCLLEHDNWMRLRRMRLLKNQGQSDGEGVPRLLSPHEVTLQPDPRQKNEGWRGHILGGSFSMDIPLSRKHGVIHLGRMKPGRLELNGNIPRVLWAFGQLNTST